LAGIGFELRKLLKRESLLGIMRAYGYAGIISSGPWVLSILGIMLVGILSVGKVSPSVRVQQFLVVVNYIMAGSLILTGLLQLMFTRFVADRLFQRKKNIVVPNLMGVLTLTSLVSGGASTAVVAYLFDEGLVLKVLMVVSFVAVCDVWMLVVLMSGLKSYRRVLAIFVGGYGISIAASLGLRRYNIEGLMGGFLLGQVVLLFLMLAAVVRDHPRSRTLVSFDFLRPKQSFYSLALTGFFYNLGIWADKLMFWFNPVTSEPVIGPLRSSVIYDLPIFLAYLSIIPGMAVFLVRIETDFAEHYDLFYNAVREGDTLPHIEHLRQGMTFYIRQGIYEIFKVQGLTLLVLLLAGARILEAIGISSLYLQLFYVDLVAVGVQVLLLSILNVLFYLDQREFALALTFLFTVLNIALTWLTLWLGPAFYGYGFAGATILTSFVGIIFLSRLLAQLEYETFMLQK
jgi:polysaccharide biosynthesis protein PelG